MRSSAAREVQFVEQRLGLRPLTEAAINVGKAPHGRRIPLLRVNGEFERGFRIGQPAEPDEGDAARVGHHRGLGVVRLRNVETLQRFLEAACVNQPIDHLEMVTPALRIALRQPEHQRDGLVVTPEQSVNVRKTPDRAAVATVQLERPL